MAWNNVPLYRCELDVGPPPPTTGKQTWNVFTECTEYYLLSDPTISYRTHGVEGLRGEREEGYSSGGYVP